MPYEIVEDDGRYCVHKVGGEAVPGGCHDTLQEAERHMAALYANEDDAAGPDQDGYEHDGDLTTKSDMLAAFGGSIKALGDGRIGGYLVAWGDQTDRDLQGDYFTPQTDFVVSDYPIVGEPVMYHHGMDKQIGPRRLTRIAAAKFDDVGIWVEAQMNLRDAYQRAIYALVERGALDWSSGALPQAVVRERDGHIRRWPIIEGSLTPTPAQPFKTKIVTVKSLHELPTSGALSLEGLWAEEEGRDDGQPRAKMTEAVEQPPEEEEFEEMTQEQIERIVKAAVAGMFEALNIKASEDDAQAVESEAVTKALTDIEASRLAETTDEADAFNAIKSFVTSEEFLSYVADRIAERQRRYDEVEAAAKSAASMLAPRSRVEGHTTPRTARIEVSTKYAGLSADDMAFYAYIMSRAAAARHREWQPSEQFLREMANKVDRQFDQGGYQYLPEDSEAFKAIKSIKANELNYSTQTDYGKEWVADLWSSDLWRRARIENRVLSLLPTIDMPSNPFNLPLEDADPTVYRVAETTDDAQLNPGASTPFTRSKLRTENTSITAYKMGLQVALSTEMEEDSIIPFIAQLRTQALEAMNDAMEYVVLHADNTTGTTNINKAGGTVNAADVDKWMLGFKGIAHLPLVTNTALLHNIGAAPALADLRAIRRKLPARYISRLSDLVYITDPTTATKLIEIDEVLTMDKVGPMATVLTGQIAMIDGIPIVQSEWLEPGNTAGVISATPADNTKGRILLVYRPAWRVGYRRRVTMDLTFLPYRDAYIMTSTVRIGLIRQDDECAALGYNATI